MQTVLLVDDDRRVSSAYLRVLQDLNVKVFIASAMSEAQEIAKTCQDISVVITDYRLPDGDGLSLIKNIREICIKRERSKSTRLNSSHMPVSRMPSSA